MSRQPPALWSAALGNPPYRLLTLTLAGPREPSWIGMNGGRLAWALGAIRIGGPAVHAPPARSSSSPTFLFSCPIHFRSPLPGTLF